MGTQVGCFIIFTFFQEGFTGIGEEGPVSLTRLPKGWEFRLPTPLQAKLNLVHPDTIPRVWTFGENKSILLFYC